MYTKWLALADVQSLQIFLFSISISVTRSVLHTNDTKTVFALHSTRSNQILFLKTDTRKF